MNPSIGNPVQKVEFRSNNLNLKSKLSESLEKMFVKEYIVESRKYPILSIQTLILIDKSKSNVIWI